ncbi:mitochondrial ribosomal protein L2 [Tachypleus tridentatus]|uniref:mitochondrial ribosomal protein L2 n=1 Tax=Tachypleus tridentatus TaxID=6853 RepID=UPI003FD3F7D9
MATSLLNQAVRSLIHIKSFGNLQTIQCAQQLLSFEPNILSRYISVRFRYRKIRGGGRPLPWYVPKPTPRIYGWKSILPSDGKYTTKPLPVVKLGGRVPETGRVAVRTLGGGHKKLYRWVDNKRHGPTVGQPVEEKVFHVRYDPCRTAKIALVASGSNKRWILATDGVKTGDILRTTGHIPRIPVRPKEGDAHPLGALPIGTLIHSIEVVPGKGGLFCRAAGSCAQLLRKVDKFCIVQLPSKQEISLPEECMAVVGRVSNIDYNKKPIGSANRNRWLGRRPRSGWWHRKDGYCGRKIKPLPPVKEFGYVPDPKPEIYQLTF